MESEFGFKLPKAMHVEFGKIINILADELGNEISSSQIRRVFEETYLQCTAPFALESFHAETRVDDGQVKSVECTAQILIDGKAHELHGVGNGPINAFMQAMKEELVPDFSLLFYSEHSLQKGSGAEAVAYIQIDKKGPEPRRWLIFKSRRHPGKPFLAPAPPPISKWPPSKPC
jgi:2-isopropylmalate synthase